MTTPVTDLRKKHTRLLGGSAAAMTVAGADMAPGSFVDIAWQNLTFAGCNFVGDGSECEA
jgi:hypothetical protein